MTAPTEEQPNQIPQDESVLARFIQISAAALACPNFQEAAAVIVNRLGELISIDRAALISLEHGDLVQSVTGGTVVAKDNLFSDAIEEVKKHFGSTDSPTIVPTIMPKEDGIETALAKLQQNMDGTNILWFPIVHVQDKNRTPTGYVLWLERWRGASWFKEEVSLLEHLIPFFSHALLNKKQKKIAKKSRKKLIWSILGLFIIIMFIPIESRVVAPTRVVPEDPHYVFAPLDGIFKDLFVEPGEMVKKDQVLFSYDARVLDKRLAEAYSQEEVALAELYRLEGVSHTDPEALGKIPVQKLEVAKAQADVAFYKDQRARADVKTSMNGIVVLDDPDSLIGASLQTGQLIMSIADPENTKVRMMVPVSDAGLLKIGAEVQVRLDRDPLTSYKAKVTHIGFEVKLSDEQVSSVMVEAKWDKIPPNIQPGQRGSAKIYAESSFFGLQLFRRPLIVLREITGV